MPVHSPDYTTADGSRFNQNPMLSPSEIERVTVFNEAWADTHERGFKRTSVILFSPWTLSLDGVSHQGKRIHGVPTDPEMWRTQQPRVQLKDGGSVPVTHHVITVPYIGVGTRFRGTSDENSMAETRASVDLPIGLGKDMAHQHNLNESQGGIVAYDSDLLPEDAVKIEGIHGWLDLRRNVPLQEAFELAYNAMLRHMNSLVGRAEKAFSSGSKTSMNEIRGDRHRVAVQYLLNAGQLTTEPKWYTERSESSKQKSVHCPMCRERVNANAVKCGCDYILDPFTAYGKLYTEEMAGGLMTARRMTREQLEFLNLYPRIKPLDEWLAEQNESEAEPKKGKKA